MMNSQKLYKSVLKIVFHVVYCVILMDSCHAHFVKMDITVTPLANAHGRLGRKLGGTGGWAAVRGPP